MSILVLLGRIATRQFLNAALSANTNAYGSLVHVHCSAIDYAVPGHRKR
jgi:hypothetical protein